MNCIEQGDGQAAHDYGAPATSTAKRSYERIRDTSISAMDPNDKS